MTLSLAILLAAATAVCEPPASGTTSVIRDERDAVAAAKVAWRGTFEDSLVNAGEPYRAELRGGVWHVSGTLPSGKRGGTPEALICGSSGKALKVFHTQ